jgi:hypothetical protein
MDQTVEGQGIFIPILFFDGWISPAWVIMTIPDTNLGYSRLSEASSGAIHEENMNYSCCNL